MSTLRATYHTEPVTPTGGGVSISGTLSLGVHSAPPASVAPASVAMDTLSRQLNHSRALRIREALFPETALTEAQLHQHLDLDAVAKGLGDQPSSVQQLAEPAQILRLAVTNLINYQEDADVALHAAGELARLLLSSDALTCQRASSLTLQLAKKQACRLAFAVQADLIEALLIVIHTTQSVETLRFAVGALCHICQAGQGCITVYQCGRVRAVPELLRLLGSQDERTRGYALSCLHHLLVRVEQAKDEARMCSGVQRLADLFLVTAAAAAAAASSSTPKSPMSAASGSFAYGGGGSGEAETQEQKMLAVCIDCLQLLAYANQESKLVIHSCGALAQLVDLARRSRYEKLLFSVIRLLKVLSVDGANKAAIIAAGGMSALGRHLKSNSERLVINTLWTLRNLSDQAYSLTREPLDDMLVDLIDLLSSGDFDCVTCAAAVLCNMTCRNRRNKLVVTTAGGASALTRTLLSVEGREEIAEPLICALRHITHDHQQARAAADIVVELGLTSSIGDLLNRGFTVGRPLLKAALGLCRNLATHPMGRAAMHAQAAPDAAAAAVVTALAAAEDDRMSLTAGSAASASDGGVRPEEVLEAALACLLALSGGDGDDAVGGGGVGDVAELRRQREACVAAVRALAGLPDKLADVAASGFGACSSHASRLLDRLSGVTASAATLQSLKQQQAVQPRHYSSSGSVGVVVGGGGSSIHGGVAVDVVPPFRYGSGVMV